MNLIITSFTLEYWPALLFIIAISLVAVYARQAEKQAWNNGICKETNMPWTQFDTSSQGCRGYTSGSHNIWVSWPVDKIKEIK